MKNKHLVHLSQTVAGTLLLSLLIAGTLISTKTASPVFAAQAGIYSEYGMNEGSGSTIADSSGNGKTGTITSPSWTASGKYGGGLTFNGSSYVTLGNFSTLVAPYTIEFWFKLSSLPTAGKTIKIFGQGGCCALDPSLILQNYDGVNYKLGWIAGADKYVYGTKAYTSADFGVWNHIAFVVDSSTALTNWKVYLNGADNTGLKAGNSGTFINFGATTTIGGNDGYSNYENFKGTMDEFRTYSVALTQGQIQTDMNTAVGGASDTTAPTVSISAPSAGSTLSATNTVSATASDNVGVAGVQFKLDGANLGAEDTSSPYSISWDTTSATNASHTLTAAARDAAGNTTTSSSISVTVNNSVADSTPPTVSISSPTAGATVSGSSTSITANASDNVAVAGVQFKLDGVNLGAEDTSSPYAVTWDTTAASNSAHTLTAVARDTSNNTTTSSSVSVTVNNAVSDTTAPTVSISAPSAGSTLSATNTVSATASDNVGVAGVQFKLDGANLGAEDTSSPYSISWDTTSATNTSHTLTAVARDTSNNTTTSTSVAVTVSNAAAFPTISFSASPNSITQGSSSTLSWSTTNATSVTIDQGIGSVATSGTRVVTPSVSTTYTLSATGAGGTAAASTVITVSATPPPSGTATYYVDPSAGNDANAGTSQAAAWKTLPGTRTASDSGFVRATWGAISTSNHIKASNIIEIKAGTSMTSAIGGRLLVDPTYYDSGSSASPIVIRVSSSWGSGNFTYNASGITVPLYLPAIFVTGVNYIQLRGNDASRRFVVSNAGGGGWGLIASGSFATHQQGITLDFMEFASNGYGGSSVFYSDNFTVSNSLAHNNGDIGFDTGGVNDQNSNVGTFSDDESYSNGSPGSTNIAHGFGLYGSTNITYLRDFAHDNGRDGFDMGTTSNANSTSATIINSSSYNNGEDGFGGNGGYGSETNVYTYINTISFGNQQSGWYIYAGADANYDHVIGHNNGNQASFGGNFMWSSEGTSSIVNINIKNSIGYQPRLYANVYSYNALGAPTNITSSNNIWYPRASNSEIMAETPYGTTFTYQEIIAGTRRPTWFSATDKIGTSFNPGFVSAGTTNFLTNNYHLSSGTGPAINAGVYISSPAAATFDRDGVTRSNPPEIGIYEFGGVVTPPPPPPPPAANTLPLGNFDGLKADGVTLYGWSYDPDSSTSQENLQIFINGPVGTGTLIGTVATTFLRSDVNTSKSITGNHGFEFPIPSQYQDGLSHSYYVYGIDINDSTKSTLLTGSPKSFTVAIPPCQTSSTTWQNSTFASQSGTFTAQFDSTANGTGLDAVVGLSSGAASDYTNLATIFRFSAAGLIDARNGGVYSADSSFSYVVGTSYHVRMVVNVTTHTYSVFVTPPSAAEVTIASNYAFRTEQNAVAALNNMAFVTINGTHNVCNFAVTTGTVTPTPTPTPLPPPPPPPAPNVLPSGNFDGLKADGVTLYGWSYDPDSSSASNSIQIFVNGAVGTGTLINSQLTSFLRSDVNTSKSITGNHGFEFVIPNTYRDGLSHSYYVYGIDINDSTKSTLLTGSPKSFTLTLPDTTPPTVSITAPTSGATVSVSTTISATASDNVGVLGVQFKLDGNNLNAEDTTSPYSIVWNTTTSANGSHSITAIARDAATNQTTSATTTITVNNVTADTTAPSTPTNLAATVISSTQINLSWTASTDNIGVVGYKVFRNGTQIATPVSTSYNDTGLIGSTTYSYTVSAQDAANNSSSQSSSVSGTTQAPLDTTPPTVSISAPVSGSTVSGTTTISATASDNIGVAGVQFKLDGANLGPEDTSSPYSFNWDTTVTANTTHSLTAVARDSAGNSTTSSAITITVNNVTADTTAPSTPTNLAATVISSTQINLSWTTSTDNIGVVGYKVFRNGTQIATPVSTSYNDTTLVGSTSYSYTVSAVDAANNSSTQSSSVSGTTQAPLDTTLPSTPTNLAATVISSTQINLSWTASTDNIGVVGYKVFRNGTQIATPVSTTYNDTSLIGSTAYSYTISAQDAANNSSSQSTPASATTPVPPDVTPPTVSISAPANGSTISGSSAAVSATSSDNIGVVGVQFKLDGANLGPEDTTSPYSFNWDTTLTANATHSLTAVARDSAGNSTTSTAITVTVNNVSVPPPSTAPVISSLAVVVSRGNATITWTTDKPSSSQVEYGATTSYGSSSALDSTLVTSHSRSLLNLASGTYNFRALSVDSGNTLGTSGNSTFVVRNKPLKIATVSATSGSVILSWSTPMFDGFSGIAILKATTGFGTAYDPALLLATTTTNTYRDTNIASGTTYYYSLFTYDDQNDYSDPQFVSFSPVVTPTPTPTPGPSPTPTPTPTPVGPGPIVVRPNLYPTGTILKYANNPTVYIKDGDTAARPITDITVYQNQVPASRYIITVPSTVTFDQGSVIGLRSGTLIRASNNPTVYLMVNDQKRPFSSAQEFLGNNYQFSQVYTINDNNLVNAIPTTSEPFQRPRGTLFKYANSPTVYFLASGGKKIGYTTLNMFKIWNATLHDVVTIPDTEVYEDGPVATFPNGILVKGSSSTTYFVFNGVLRPFANTDLFTAMGLNFNQVTTFSDADIALHTIGSPME